MCIRTMEEKMMATRYKSIDEFKRDVSSHNIEMHLLAQMTTQHIIFTRIFQTDHVDV